MLRKNKTLLYPGCKIVRKLPVNADPGQASDFNVNTDLAFKPVSLFQYSDVNVTPEGIVFKNFEIDKDLLIYPAHIRIYNFLYLASSLVKRKKITLPPEETYLLCFDYWSNSIFHWMCDVLPRLEAVKELAKSCVFLLPDFYHYPYILETLKAYQFKDIYLLKDSVYVHCKKLYAPEQIATSGRMLPQNILSLRETLLRHFRPAFSGKIGYQNVYVSRNKARFRKVLNEAALLPVLEKYNFKLLYFEDFKVSEQIELCYNAINMVSIHGANLTNVIFMQPGRQVLELRKRGDLDNNYFYELADSVSCSYFHLDCEFEDPEPHKNTFNLYADVQKFDQALKQLTHA